MHVHDQFEISSTLARMPTVKQSASQNDMQIIREFPNGFTKSPGDKLHHKLCRCCSVVRGF